MPLGTLDRTPPPFFRQGPSAASKLVFFSALAVFLMVADARFKMATPLRDAVAAALLPLQRTVAAPLTLVHEAKAYMQGLGQARESEQRAREQLAAQSARAALATELTHENLRLRALLDLQPTVATRSTPAQVLYEAADPYTRKVFVDRGSAHGVLLGAPVITELGVLGQATRVYSWTSEVTLLEDKDATVPVINTRSQLRGVAFGGAQGGGMELRYTAANADVQVGDVLHTSGLDGVYPPGLAVATVRSVDRLGEAGFARILLSPAALADGVRFVLALEPTRVRLPQPPPEASERRPARGPARQEAPRPGLAETPSAGALPARPGSAP